MSVNWILGRVFLAGLWMAMVPRTRSKVCACESMVKECLLALTAHVNLRSSAHHSHV